MHEITGNWPSYGLFKQQYIPDPSCSHFFLLFSFVLIYTYIYKGLQSISSNLPSLSRTLTRLGKQHGRGDKEGCFSYCANLPLQQFFSHNLYKKYTDKANRFGQQGINTLPKPFRGSATVTKTPLTSQFGGTGDACACFSVAVI